MVRFSCFHSHIHGQKTKKQAQSPFETMINGQLLSSKDLGSLQRSPCLDKSDCESRNDVKDSQISLLVANGSKLGEMNTCLNNTRLSPVRDMRRSLSLGCNLQDEGMLFEENNSDENFGLGFPRDRSHDQLHHAPSRTQDQDQDYASVEPLNISCGEINNECIFSVSDQQYLEKECHENDNIQLDDAGAIDFGILTLRSPSMITRSNSLPNLLSMFFRSGGYSHGDFSVHRSRSSEDLKVLGVMKKEKGGRSEDYSLFKPDKIDGKNGVPDGYDNSYNYTASNKDWVIPVSDDEMFGVQASRGESSSHQLDQLPSDNFKIKRIENWVIDLQECGPVEEVEEIHDPCEQVHAISSVKEEVNMNLNMQVAKKYISSLSASATAAQLMNHGLAAIPFLSAFVSLKVVNLSGNSIVKITAGSLPRGLHMLNLSKNKISTIEGLRELARLRILDLSYNRITRIGHGLASCSSLKELYIAGNKISEVEGLHRLLKLTILDLRFNKISTSKGLGQLAANYNSLQAISVEGNPAQKNVGDEQLKKHLQGLLPNLNYYNRQSIKSSSSLKDSSDRSVRLGMAAHQFDRGHKSTVRRPHKGQSGDPPKRSRSKQGNVPPTGSRTSHRHHHHRQGPPLELNMKPLVIPDFNMKKSQSMGALTAL